MNGLSCRFQLVGGGFRFISDSEKAKDDIWFYATFDRFRVYTSDFGGNFSTLLQKPTGLLILSRTLLTGRIRTGIKKYVPNVEIDNIDIGFVPPNRKQLYFRLEYRYTGNSSRQVNDVIFI